MPARALSKRARMPLKLLGPSLATLSLPGCAFARSMNSCILRTGSAEFTSNANGTLASIGYPNNGGLLTHSYDATGRLTGLSLNGNPLVTGIAWNPLGQPTAWTWAFASPTLAASRSYDKGKGAAK